MAIKGDVEQGVAFVGVEGKLGTVAGDFGCFWGGEGILIAGVRDVAETIGVLAKGNITIAIVAAFATFRIRFQENRIGFGAELK